MKRKILFLIVISVFTLKTIAQSTRYFEEILGRPAPAIENTLVVLQLMDGSYITLGGNMTDAIFMKTDAFGDSLLDSIYTYSGYKTLWYDAKLLNDTNLIAAGWHNQQNYVHQVDTTEQMWLAKMDTTGQIIWTSLVGDSILPTSAYCIEKTYDGGYILGGTTDTIPTIAIIVKTDSNGNQLWEERFTTGIASEANAIYGIAATTDSGFVLTGGSGDNISISHSLVRFTKIDKYGSVQKDTSYNISSSYNSVGESIVVCPDGGYIIGSVVGAGGILLKLNSNDSIVWQTTPFGGGFNKIILLSDGSIVGCGAISHVGGYASLLIKYDSLGNEIWRRDFKFSSSGYIDVAYGFDTTSDGGFILCGRTEHPNGSDVPFIKTNCLGFVGPPTASFTDSLGSLSTIYFRNTSENTDTCYWNWGDGSPIQMVRADSIVPVYHNYINNQGAHHVTLIAIACGEIDSISIITPFVTSTSSLSAGEGQGVRLFPNPNDGSFTLNYSLPSSKREFIIKDVTGRMVYSTTVSGTEGTQTIDVSNLSRGIYYWEVISESGVSAMGKLAVIK